MWLRTQPPSTLPSPSPHLRFSWVKVIAPFFLLHSKVVHDLPTMPGVPCWEEALPQQLVRLVQLCPSGLLKGFLGCRTFSVKRSKSGKVGHPR